MKPPLKCTYVSIDRFIAIKMKLNTIHNEKHGERKLANESISIAHLENCSRCDFFLCSFVFLSLLLDLTSLSRCVFPFRTTHILATMKVQRCQEMCKYNNLHTLPCLNLINNTVFLQRYHLQNVRFH